MIAKADLAEFVHGMIEQVVPEHVSAAGPSAEVDRFAPLDIVNTFANLQVVDRKTLQ
jgi:hypothetical protein